MDSMVPFLAENLPYALVIILVIVFATANRPDRWIIVLRGLITLLVSLVIIEACNTYIVNPPPLAPVHPVAGKHRHRVVHEPPPAQVTPPVNYYPSEKMMIAFGCAFLASAFNPIATLIMSMLGIIVAWNLAETNQQNLESLFSGIIVAAFANFIAWLIVRPKKI